MRVMQRPTVYEAWFWPGKAPEDMPAWLAKFASYSPASDVLNIRSRGGLVVAGPRDVIVQLQPEQFAAISEAGFDGQWLAEPKDGTTLPAPDPDDGIVADPVPTDLPKFRSHKTVSAARIVDGMLNTLILEVGSETRHLNVLPSLTARYRPALGDYYVVYEDGYASISPKAAFEGGYSALREAEPAPASIDKNGDGAADTAGDGEGRSTSATAKDGDAAGETPPSSTGAGDDDGSQKTG